GSITAPGPPPRARPDPIRATRGARPGESRRSPPRGGVPPGPSPRCRVRWRGPPPQGGRTCVVAVAPCHGHRSLPAGRVPARGAAPRAAGPHSRAARAPTGGTPAVTTAWRRAPGPLPTVPRQVERTAPPGGPDMRGGRGVLPRPPAPARRTGPGPRAAPRAAGPHSRDARGPTG